MRGWHVCSIATHTSVCTILRIDVNGQRLARALSSEPFVIPRLSDATLTLVATTNLIDVLRQAIALPDAGARCNYVLSGRVFLDRLMGWLSFTREGGLIPESMTTP
ncbi:MAG: LEA type 2 family protein [Myxococcota bacterium]